MKRRDFLKGSLIGAVAGLISPKTADADYYADANHYTGAQESLSIKQERERLEKAGWREWLMTMFPFAFEEEFSDDHIKFWDLFWSVLMRIREQKKYFLLGLPCPDEFHIKQKEYVILLILGRGLAKSSTIEASSVVRGALLDGGYCLYVCETQDQANEHIGNCRGLIENGESRLTEFYPGMAILDGAVVEGIKTKDKADIFITKNGWICRAKGLMGSMRGLRIGKRRLEDINIDDIDSESESPAVSLKKLKRMLSALLPAQARRWTTIKFGQNLINETGVMNMIYTGKSTAFAERTTVGVTNTFVSFVEGEDYEQYLDTEDGRIKYRILPGARTTWSGVDLEDAQKFLNQSTLEVFLAEYQNQFEHLRTGKVFHEFNEQRHVIEWQDFKRVFGIDFIPPHWNAAASADLGYSNKSLSAWQFTAASAQNTPLPGHYFCYRFQTFLDVSIDDQAETLWEEMFPDPARGKLHFEARQKFADYPELFRLLETKERCRDLLKNYTYDHATNRYYLNPAKQNPIHSEPHRPDNIEQTEEEKILDHVRRAAKTFRSQIRFWRISHEKTGEQKTLAQKYGIPVEKTKDFKNDSGVAEANHLLRGDYTQPHPFFPDRILDEADAARLKRKPGTYLLGRPYLYFIVENGQKQHPTNDAGMKTARQHLANQRWTVEKLTEQGLSRTIPMKYESDCGDALRMFTADYALPAAEPLTLEEEFYNLVPNAVLPKPNESGEVDFSKKQQQQLIAAQMRAASLLKDKYGTDVFEHEAENRYQEADDDEPVSNWWDD